MEGRPPGGRLPGVATARLADMQSFAWKLREDGRIREAGRMFMKAACVGTGHWTLFGRGLLLSLCPWLAHVKDFFRS